ncbi:MAG TPA: DPP IV N-terminal domain-containing protein, partial [Urbifossiella sp.]|nr:DPP IV N-terminal domain-containing protein [Urbifossiella sp.]
AAAQEPRTPAERADFAAATRHADIVAFGEELAKRSPRLKASTFGTSHEGRPLPLWVLADPPVSSPAEASKSGKLVVLAFANIHAGEIDGKDALCALARDLVTAKDAPLLKELVVLLVPVLNADGNEKLDPKNRPNEPNPAGGVGRRENAQGFDLNRDFVKLETPEVRALVKLMTAWDPLVVVDCHTTNGSKHRWTLTHDGPRYPTSDSDLSRWAHAVLLPEAGKRVKAATGFDTGPYGNFNPDRTRWETYPALPRYGIQSVALRNRVGVLSESYSYAPYRDRVFASWAFVKGVFETVAEKKDDVKRVTARTPAAIAVVPLRTTTTAYGDKLAVPGFEKDQPTDLALSHVARTEAAHAVARPAAYVVSPKCAAAVATLRRHGVAVEELREDVLLDVEAYRLDRVEEAAKAFQGHKLRTLAVTKRGEARTVPAGAFVVKTAQPLGALAAYLLEPEAEDGLAAWNLFDNELRPGADYPALRVAKLPPVLTGPPRPLPEDRKALKTITEELLILGKGFTFGLAGNPATGLQWLDDGEHFLQTKGDTLLKVHARTGRSEPATPKKGTPAPKVDGKGEFATASPDGQRVAFVRKGNLFVAAGKDETQLTDDGGKDILNGKADWVYYEELFNRNYRAFWWSPNSDKLVFLRFDDAPVKRYHLVDLQTPNGALETVPYPKPGDPNPLVTIGVANPAGGRPTFLDLTGYPPADTLVARVGWLPDGKTVYAYLQNRTQTWLDVVVWKDAAGPPVKLFRDTTGAWVDEPGAPRFLPDGSFLFASDRTGFRHLYHYAADGTLRNAVTAGEWEVRAVERIDADAVYVTGTKDGPTRLHLYRAALDGSKLERLTDAGGSHAVTLAPKGNLFLDRFTDDATPTQVYVSEAGKGRVRTVDTNPVYEREQYRFGKFEAVSVPLADGFTLNGTLVYPPDFDAAKKYPVWLFTYAGPHAPTVKEGWGGGRIMDQSLAATGVVVFRVDPRTASGQGMKAAWPAYKQLGVQELVDLEAAVDWLDKRGGWVDRSRVGISGHSYGGFMTAFALTHSKTFSAGIASGPVTDWGLYDTIYTERYMLTPAENPKGYAASSVVGAAKDLHGRLLLVHGLMDDNVHAQNTLRLVDALQQAGKDFELMIYPRARHGIGGPHFLRLQLGFIRRTMGVRPGEPGA